MKLLIRDIRLDCGTQSRASLNQDTINQYAEDMTEGAVFPPPVVFYDGEKYILSVGFHRVHAALQAGFQDIECEVINGTLRDARLYSIKSNSDHGLPRTNADKKHAVKMAFQQLMEDGRNIRDVDKVSHKEVADMAAVHRQYVSSVRGDIEKELLGDVRIGQPPTIPTKSKEKSSEDTQRLKDELARLKAEKDALAEKQRKEVEARARAEGDLISVRNQLEFLRNKAKEEKPEPERVEVEVEVIKEVVPPAIQAKIREQENLICELQRREVGNPKLEEKRDALLREIQQLREQTNQARSEKGLIDGFDFLQTASSVTEKIVDMAGRGTLTIEQITEAERIFKGMLVAANNGIQAIRDIQGITKEGGGLRVVR